MSTASAVERAGAAVTAADIPWTFAPSSSQPPADDPLVEALVAVDAYRVLAQQAIHYAHALQRELRALQSRYERVLDENRARRPPHRSAAS